MREGKGVRPLRFRDIALLLRNASGRAPHIARALRGEEEYFVTLDSALRLSRVLDAARLSSRTGQEVWL